MKRVFEIQREDVVIRVEIPKMSEDSLLLVSITAIFCALIHAIASVL